LFSCYGRAKEITKKYLKGKYKYFLVEILKYKYKYKYSKKVFKYSINTNSHVFDPNSDTRCLFWGLKLPTMVLNFFIFYYYFLY